VQVRNAATLCFTALVVRMVGFRNQAVWESQAITGAEFFQRFPALHPYLHTQLLAATEALEQDVAQQVASPLLGARSCMPKVRPEHNT
jgi:hypothetical protein